MTVVRTESRSGLLKNSPFYAGFAVDDIAKAKRFYADALGVFPSWRSARAFSPCMRATGTPCSSTRSRPIRPRSTRS